MSRAAKPVTPASNVGAAADTEWIQEQFDDVSHVVLNLLQALNAVEHLAAEGNSALVMYRSVRGIDDGTIEFDCIEDHARAAREGLREVTDGVLRLREDLRKRLPMPAKDGAS